MHYGVLGSDGIHNYRVIFLLSGMELNWRFLVLSPPAGVCGAAMQKSNSFLDWTFFFRFIVSFYCLLLMCVFVGILVELRLRFGCKTAS